MLNELKRLFLSPWNLIEVGILFLLLWALMTVLRGSRGEGMLKTLGIFLAVGFLALRSVAIHYNLDRLTVVLDAIFQASVVALVVIFQPELRRGLALRIGEQWLAQSVPEEQVVEEVVSACERLARGRVGALIAFERKETLKAYVTSGTLIDAEVKADLLRNIFYPGSPLHDGAVVLQGGRIAAAGCFLPLSENPEIPKSLGTRHRAAIGLSEHTDALVVVVSEETGIISLTERGQIHRDLDRDSLTTLLTQHYLHQGDSGPDVNASLSELSAAGETGTKAGSKPELPSSSPPAIPNKTTTRMTRRIAT